jgi:hypothetical protein
MSEEPTSMPRTAPDLLTLEEAAAILRIGRSKAYEQARRFEASGGAEGIPVVRCGKSFRVPRCALEAMLGGPITWPPPGWIVPAAALTSPAPVPAPAARTRSRSSSRREPTPRLFTA